MGKLGTTGLVVGVMAAAAGILVASCGQTPVNVPIHTMEGAQKVAVICLEVNDPATGVPLGGPSDGGIGYHAVAQNLCAPTTPGVVGTTLPYHLIAAVTQTTRGELAIVDVTGGYVVDEDQSTPGINFIPIGTNPTDVVTAPGNAPDFTYVSSASPTKPAIFAIPNSNLLGDSTNDKSPPLLLTSLVACSLPQPPLALAVVGGAPSPNGTSGSADGGADGGTGADAGAGAASPAPSDDYQLLAVLGTQGGGPARVVAIDSRRHWNQGPGDLEPCNILGSVMLSSELPPSWSAGPEWSDGVPYVDGGVGDLSAVEPAVGPPGICSAPLASDAGVTGTGTPGAGGSTPEAGAPAGGPPGADASADAATLDADIDAEVGAGADDAEADAGTPSAADASSSPMAAADAGFPFVLAPLSAPNPASIVMRDDAPLLYVADSSLPVIHVIDMTDPTSPKELSPLLATSIDQPSRQVSVGGLALSPPTRDYKRYLYAIDTAIGALMVYDVTDPTDGAATPHGPLLRPHAELNPFMPADRITFSAPVATVGFAQHDWPLVVPSTTTANQSIAYQGLLCNPNVNAHSSPNAYADLGAYYRVDNAQFIQANATAQNFPGRLRGIFGFATLTNGTLVAIDVDDWDAPCRRPDPMSVGNLTGSLDVPEPDAGPGDLDPYHAPLTYSAANLESPAVTLEQYYPVSAPHRIRSSVLLRNDPTSGNHLPNVVQPPQLSDVNGTPIATSGNAGVAEPLLLPTVLDDGFVDPTIAQNPTEPDPSARTYLPDAGTAPDPATSPTPGVRLSFEDPTVQQSQDWSVTYEGVLPSSSGLVATIESTAPEGQPDAYTTLTFGTQGADVCGLGVEDWSIGQARAKAALAAMDPTLAKTVASLPTYTADYVEITDDILLKGDPYWSLPNACWDGIDPSVQNAPSGSTISSAVASNRYDLCQSTYGAPVAGENPDLQLARDAPILAAYKDHMIVGRFGFSSPIQRTQNRSIDPGSSLNPQFLKLMACCFHKEATFKVRAGGEWIAVGQQTLGLLHHVVATPSPAASGDAGAPSDPNANRCVLSCDPRDKLLNGRSFDVPWSTPTACTPNRMPAIGRNSPLAMRNPLFSYVTWGGCGPPTLTGDHTLTARDSAWRFTVAGGFTPLTISLAGTTAGTTVSPQSMLFVGSLGQIAVVDGADQGLILIDLNSLAFGANYF